MLEGAVDHLNLEMVLENKVAVGTVNANRRHFEAAADHLGGKLRRWPDFLEHMIQLRHQPRSRPARGCCEACRG